jgi:putative peptidoglycan lipid II flippase
MPFFIKIIAPGIINNEKIFNDIVKLARFTIVFLPFISMTAFFGAMLNASGRFFYFAFTPIIFNLSIIISCFFITDAMKIKSLPLAIAMPISGFIQLCFVYYFVNKFDLITKVFFKTSNLKQNNFKKFKNNILHTLKRFFPAVLSGGVFQINILVDTILATLVGFGAVSFLYYSDRIIQLPLGIIGVSLGTVLLSSISHPKVVNDNKKISDQLILAIKITLYFSIPSMITLLCFSEFIISSLFERGSFNKESTKSVALALSMYSIGLPFVMIIKCFQSVFIATGEIKKILYISILQLITNFTLSIILMKYFSHGGIALATSISTILSFIIYLFYILKKQYLIFVSINSKNYKSTNNILFYFIKITILSLFMISILYLFQSITASNSGMIYLSIFTSIGILFYIFITYFTKQIPNELFSKLKL